MNIVAVIPIKTISQRVPKKNFRMFAGHPLYKYILSSALRAKCFDEIYTDTDSDEIKDYARAMGIKVIDRVAALAQDNANGNDLLCYHANIIPTVDCFFQLFATAPLLEPTTIKKCVDFLKKNNEYDSIFTVTKEYGWFWSAGHPVNYLPNVLPRSQDAQPVFKETTGLYGVRTNSLMRYRSRIGAKPYLMAISGDESLDIDTEFDFKYAQTVALEKGLAGNVLDFNTKSAPKRKK